MAKLLQVISSLGSARGLFLDRGGDAPNDGSNSDEVRAA
jgi:hypothetical protein